MKIKTVYMDIEEVLANRYSSTYILNGQIYFSECCCGRYPRRI